MGPAFCAYKLGTMHFLTVKQIWVDMKKKKTRALSVFGGPSQRRGHTTARGLVPAPHAPHTSTASNRGASASLGLSHGRRVGSCAPAISGVERFTVFTVHAAARSAQEEVVRASRAHPVVRSPNTLHLHPAPFHPLLFSPPLPPFPFLPSTPRHYVGHEH